MSNDKIIYINESYPCSFCLMHSLDPNKCTNCGRIIDPDDINEATFKPPEYGTYFVPALHYPKEIVLRSIKESIDNFYQIYKIEKNDDGILIHSNEIAYRVFITKLAEASLHDSAQTIKEINFLPD